MALPPTDEFVGSRATIPMDEIVCQDCIPFMDSLEENSIDAVITSPPYAEQRKNTYGGIPADEYSEWMAGVAVKIQRILKPTGSFVLNVKEHVENGERSTYVLETVLRLSKILHWSDTFIWNKTNPFPTGSKKRLKDGFEYCYFFTKTKDFKFFPNNVLKPTQSKYFESEQRRKNKGSHNVNNGSGMNMSHRSAPAMVRPSNVISMPIDSTNHEHPATFPIELPMFFIKLLTEEGDVVYDPFAGSGTTLLAAEKLNRHFIGTEIEQKYADLARKRVDDFCFQENLF